MKKALYKGIMTVVILSFCLSVFGQTDKAENMEFNKIFGPSINYNDTSVTLTNKTTIKHSVETCTIKAFKENGQLKWVSKLPPADCRIIYFGLIGNKKIRNSDILIQLTDKSIKGINSKNGKSINFTLEELKFLQQN
jgi:hypothetical protein